RDCRDAGEVAVAVLCQLVVRERVERLATCPRHRLDGDERQEAVLARQRELRVDPLDLDHAADVGVEVQTAIGVDLTPGGGDADFTENRAALPAAAYGPAVIAREPAVVRPALPVHQVDLEAEDGLDPSHRELEVRPEPGSRVPLRVAVSSEIA